MQVNTSKETVRLTKPEATRLEKARKICALLKKHSDSKEADVADDALRCLIVQFAGPQKRDYPLLDALDNGVEEAQP